MQLQALAALSAWDERHDSGEWDDPPAKLAPLFDLERVAAVLRDGATPFHPDRVRLAFAASSSTPAVGRHPVAAARDHSGESLGVLARGDPHHAAIG